MQKDDVGIGVAAKDAESPAIVRPVEGEDLLPVEIGDLVARRAGERLNPNVIHAVLANAVGERLSVRRCSAMHLPQRGGEPLSRHGPDLGLDLGHRGPHLLPADRQLRRALAVPGLEEDLGVGGSRPAGHARGMGCGCCLRAPPNCWGSA